VKILKALDVAGYWLMWVIALPFMLLPWLFVRWYARKHYYGRPGRWS
jgi:hypothetical protein